MIEEDAGEGCWTLFTAEAEHAHRQDGAGALASMSAGSAPPANELASITLQLVGIRLRFTHTRSASGRAEVGSGQLPTRPAAKQREVEK